MHQSSVRVHCHELKMVEDFDLSERKSGDASVYCLSDSAYLCWRCDANVHEANFLVARHVRTTLCFRCKDFDGNHFSGVGLRPVRAFCLSCSQENASACADGLEDLSSFSSSSSSSVCISTTESKRVGGSFDRPSRKRNFVSTSPEIDFSGEVSSLPPKCNGEISSEKSPERQLMTKVKAKTVRSRFPLSPVYTKVEGVLVNWCRRLGLDSNFIVSVAVDILGACFGRLPVLPFRVILAASFWLSLRLCGDRSVRTCQNLKRVEEITSIPAKLIVAAESKLAPLVKRKQARDWEEGWAECSM
ncbi:hypothetical protein Ancab_011833 [Ancistrocladus abbreviatus]